MTRSSAIEVSDLESVSDALAHGHTLEDVSENLHEHVHQCAMCNTELLCDVEFCEALPFSACDFCGTTKQAIRPFRSFQENGRPA